MIFLHGWFYVFLGTILSSLVVYLYSYPKYVCKPLFGMHYSQYVGQTLRHLLVLLAILGVTEAGIRPMASWNPWLRILTGGVAAVLVFHAVFILLYGKSDEMKYYVGLVKSKFLR